MHIENSYFLLHTEVEITLKRYFALLLASPTGTALGIELRGSNPQKVRGHIYCTTPGTSYAMNESDAGGLCFEFSALKDNEIMPRFDSVLVAFETVVSEGEVLAGTNSVITIIKVVRKKKSRKILDAAYIFGAIDIQYRVQSKEAA